MKSFLRHSRQSGNPGQATSPTALDPRLRGGDGSVLLEQHPIKSNLTSHFVMAGLDPAISLRLRGITGSSPVMTTFDDRISADSALTDGITLQIVMAGLDPAISCRRRAIPGSSPGMTRQRMIEPERIMR